MTIKREDITTLMASLNQFKNIGGVYFGLKSYVDLRVMKKNQMFSKCAQSYKLKEALSIP